MAVLAAASAWAIPGTSAAFALADVTAKARALAAKPYQAPAKVPQVLRSLNYDQYRAIHFRRKKALWSGNHFRVQFFSPGYLFKHSVKINAVEHGHVHRIRYKKSLFDYGEGGLGEELPDDVGFAGFRVHYTANEPAGSKNRAKVDEFLVFQGASYFRGKGISEKYGLSARGIAVDTAGPGDPHYEQFPRFTQFWLVRPPASAHRMTLYALLDGRSLTGAYRFRLHPGDANTTMTVKAVLFLRQPIARLGVAPLTSMFLYRPGQHRPPLFLRPAVHDSGGLLLHKRSGAWLWRPLDDPKKVRQYAFRMTDPAGFGLIQRDRDFRHYQSLTMHYENRPSAWVTPIGDWGLGHVQLVELPADREWIDNINAFWVSNRAANPGRPRHIAYRIRWGQSEPNQAMARVIATRGADGPPPATRTFYVDFSGKELALLGRHDGLKTRVSVSGGKLLSRHLRKISAQHLWRLRLSVKRQRSQSIHLQATLYRHGKALSETWDYAVPPDDHGS